ncbi:MAG: GNAT family N-acetyltransferase [Ilumatobacteraceae bacterium]|nr:GNAT family N-acetyltransferase [Ilumatobacteraceae bacterium]
MGIDVRAARPHDADAIADAHSEAWRVAYQHLVSAAFLESDSVAAARRQSWRRLLIDDVRPEGLDPDHRLYVGVLDERVVGFGHVGAVHSEDPAGAPAVADREELGELYGFYVHPIAWGTGVADRLIEQCHATLQERCGVAVLWVLSDNPRARRFYERHGWSCDTHSGTVTALWEGPIAPGVPRLETPIPETRYHKRFDI